MADEINSFDDQSIGKIRRMVRRLVAQYYNLQRREPAASRGDIGYTIRTGITTVNSQNPSYPGSGCKFVVQFEDWTFVESVGGCDLDTKPWPSKFVVAKTYDESYVEEGTRVIIVKIPGKKGRRWYILPVPC